MENNIAFLITTYNRTESLHKIYDKIKNLGTIYIVNDGGKMVNLPCRISTKQHHGREGYYITVSELWEMVRMHKYDFYIMMPDDMMPVEGFIKKALDTWRLLPNDKICLNLYVDKLRYKKNCWTMCRIEETKHYLKTGWVDGCFLATKKFFEFFNYKVGKPNRDFSDKTLGSGVGSVISHALMAQGKGMYQVKNSLFTPMKEAYDSKMNLLRTDNINEII